jgi:hypothetical protein
MLGRLFAVLVAVAATIIAPASVNAQMRQGCALGVFDQSDMAGRYVGTDAPLMLEI